MPPSCALSGGFAIGARFALIWQHNANLSYKQRWNRVSDFDRVELGHRSVFQISVCPGFEF